MPVVFSAAPKDREARSPLAGGICGDRWVKWVQMAKMAGKTCTLDPFNSLNAADSPDFHLLCLDAAPVSR